MKKKIILGKNLNKMCRLCLCENITLVDIFSFSLTFNAEISDAVFKCTSVYMKKHHRLPTFVCENCLIQLEKTSLFQNRVAQSEKILLNYLNQIQPESQDLSKNTVNDSTVSISYQIKQQEDDRQNDSSEPHIEKKRPNYLFVFQDVRSIDSDTQERYKFINKDIKHEIIFESDVDSNRLNSSYEIKQETSDNVESKQKRTETKQHSYEIKQENITTIKFEQKHTETKQNSENKQPKKYTCEICNKQFKQSGSIKNHMIIHTGDKPYQCDICGRLFNYCSKFKRHQKIHFEQISRPGDKKYECDVCSRCFTGSAGLKHHKLMHTGERPYKCELCNKTFKTPYILKVHKMQHSGEKPNKCTICGERFTHLRSMQLHILSHKGEKPFQCDFCDKRFSQSCHLKTHIRQHTGDRPYQCDVCGKCFIRSTTLKIHERVHTGEQPYQCKVCNKRFKKLSQLKSHTETHDYQT